MTAEQWTTPAEAARAQGDLAGAIALYDGALAQFPDDPAVRARLAVLLAEEARSLAGEGRLTLAEDRFARARELGGDTVATPELLVIMADARRDDGQPWEARAELLELAWQATEPPDEALTRRLAIGWDEARASDRALPYYEVYAATPAASPAIVMRVAQLQAELERTDEALTSWQRYLQLEPASVPGHIGLASIYEQQGRVADAETVLLELAAEQDEPMAVLRVLRSFYRRQGDQEGLARVEAQLAALRPEPPERNLRPLKER